MYRRFLAVLTLTVACGDDDNKHTTTDASAVAAPDGGVPSLGADAAQAPAEADASQHKALTYWQDMAPLFEAHCLQCHQAGGIASFRLDDYAEAKAKAKLIAHSVGSRQMPPWSATSDGTCGDFSGSLALSEEQIKSVTAWVEGGAQEGARGSIAVPPLAALASATSFSTPLYVPQIQGGALAEADDYRCFEIDPGAAGTRFITGYDVQPGAPAIVHHVVVTIVDPAAPAETDVPGTTNRQVMDALDAESPDRLGWPCFGLAGEGVSVRSVPVVWAPGQGVVNFPGSSGVPLLPGQKLVVQMHYNLADSTHVGKSDQTSLRLRLTDQVENVGIFALPDPLLESLYEPPSHQLEPGKPSVVYEWKRGLQELGLDKVPELKLYGVMPHMHERGRTYQMRVKTSASGPDQCGADVKRWDFHWQRLYFYREPLTMTPETEFSVRCDFDTSDATSPVLPGWGTRNEMCLATLYFTLPAKLAGPLLGAAP